MSKLSIICSLALIFVLNSSNGFALTVDEAYQAIPHSRTKFDTRSASMANNQKIYLGRIFEIIDKAVVLRVEKYLWVLKNPNGKWSQRQDILIKRANMLRIPEELKGFHQLVTSAIEEQHVFLSEVKESESINAMNISKYPRVKSSSQKLIQAYNTLMKLYSQEGEHNKKAFFDYLCALDFI